MTSAASGYDVFLSYSTVDRPHVLKVQEFLSQRGVKTFLDAQSLDTGMPGSMVYRRLTVKPLRAAAIFQASSFAEGL